MYDNIRGKINSHSHVVVFSSCVSSLQSALGMMQMLEDTLIEHAHTKPLLPSQLIRYREVQVPDGRSRATRRSPTHAISSVNRHLPVMTVSMGTVQNSPYPARAEMDVARRAPHSPLPSATQTTFLFTFGHLKYVEKPRAVQNTWCSLSRSVRTPCITRPQLILNSKAT